MVAAGTGRPAGGGGLMPIQQNTVDGASGGVRRAKGSGRGACTANADLRNTGEGGWCYTEHELFSVFLPLIGADGGMVYMAMTRLVPLAAVRAELPVTVEAVSRESCVSRSTAHRKIRELVQLGMVLETRSSSRRPSAYQLPPLRALARVGEMELRRRLDAVRGEGRTKPHGGARAEAGSAWPASTTERSEPALGERESAPGADGIPGWDTASGAALGHLSGTPESHNAASISQRQAAVSQPGIAFNLLEEEQENEDSRIPPTPQGGPQAGLQGGFRSGLQAERRAGLRFDGQAGFGQVGTAEAGSVGARVAPGLHPEMLAEATRQVLEQSGVSATRRLETMLVRQLELALQRLEAAPAALPQMVADVAAQMVERWQTYLGMCRRQELRIQWGFARFFAEGLWAQPEVWPRQAAARCASGGFLERDREPGILRSSATGAAAPTGSPARSPTGAATRCTAGSQGWAEEEQARQAAEGEAEIRQATLDYWRRMRQRGVAIYAQEAPHWVRSVLELEPALEPALGQAVVSG